MNKVLELREELIKRGLILKSELDASYATNSKSKNNYNKLSRLLYANPTDKELKNRFKVARKVKEANEKKQNQLIHRIDLFYKRNRQLVFLVGNSNNDYIKYSFLTGELFMEKEITDEIVIDDVNDYDKYISNVITENCLENVDSVKNYFKCSTNKKRLVL